MPRLRNAFFVLLALFTPLPTTAANSASPDDNAKHAAEAQRIEVLYQQKKKTLPPERQAWETLLEQNLGDPSYLPGHKRDFVNGVSTAWNFVADDPRLPRVLLLGDSISRGYTLPVRAALAGRANVHRAPENCGATANGLKKIEIWLGEEAWDVIVFNFGIHDRETAVADYEARLEQLTHRLLRTRAKLIWVSSTPLPEEPSYGGDAAIVTRNASAARLMDRHGVRIVDLHAYVTPRLSDFQKPNDVHFSPAGYEFLGQRVASEITRQLESAR